MGGNKSYTNEAVNEQSYMQMFIHIRTYMCVHVCVSCFFCDLLIFDTIRPSTDPHPLPCSLPLMYPITSTQTHSHVSGTMCGKSACMYAYLRTWRPPTHTSVHTHTNIEAQRTTRTDTDRHKRKWTHMGSHRHLHLRVQRAKQAG